MSTYRTAFMSHAHANNVLCTQYAAALRAFGIDLWIDLTNAQKGHDLSADITSQLVQRSAFIFMITAASDISPWVTLELSNYIALSHDHRTQMIAGMPRLILPVLLENISITPASNWAKIYGMNYIDAIGRPVADVAAEIARALVVDPAYPITPPPTPAPVAGPAFPLLASLRQLGFQARRSNGVEVIIPPTVFVPAGEFLMGSNKAQDPEAYDDEQPQYAIDVAAYEMAAYPVTVAEYAKYLAANPAVKAPPDTTFSDSERVNKDWRKKTMTWAIQQQQRADHPVVLVTWQNARDYAAWLAAVTGEPWRLPTEAEWEKAARGTDGRIYPWGPKWERGRANILEQGSPGMTTSIGTYAARDTTPAGCHDMIGNVLEWCHSIYLPYPFDKQKCDDNADHTNIHVLRGGSWYLNSRDARAAYRNGNVVAYYLNLCGFRLVRGVGAGSH